MKRFAVSLLIMTTIILGGEAICPGRSFASYPGLEPVEKTKAYQQYKMRPVSEYSKLLYLIDRFSVTNLDILYDGNYYSTSFVGRVARWFIAHHYNKEAAEKWVMTWANTSMTTGTLIWVKMPDGKFKLAREILSNELKELQELTNKMAREKTAIASDAVSTANSNSALPSLVTAPSPKTAS